jgi:hypothetical protein
MIQRLFSNDCLILGLRKMWIPNKICLTNTTSTTSLTSLFPSISTVSRRLLTIATLKISINSLEKERQALYQDSVDASRAAEWAFHNAVLAMKEVVRGQFGSDSNEARAVGLKKKSDRKRPVRSKTTPSKTIAPMS